MGRLLVNRQLIPQRQVCQAQGCPGPEESHREGQRAERTGSIISDLLTRACQQEDKSVHPG
jgi:hypothetical protein